MNLSAPSGETPSWGRLIGLLVGLGVFLLIVRIHRGLVASGRLKPPSPTGPGSRGHGVKPQLKAGSGSNDPTTGPDDEEEVREYEWGSVAGTGKRVEVRIKPPVERGGIEAWMAERMGWRYRDLIRATMAAWRVSESTAKRTLRRLKKAGRPS